MCIRDSIKLAQVHHNIDLAKRKRLSNEGYAQLNLSPITATSHFKFHKLSLFIQSYLLTIHILIIKEINLVYFSHNASKQISFT